MRPIRLCWIGSMEQNRKRLTSRLKRDPRKTKAEKKADEGLQVSLHLTVTAAITRHKENTKQTKPCVIFRLFRLFRLFRILFSPLRSPGYFFGTHFPSGPRWLGGHCPSVRLPQHFPSMKTPPAGHLVSRPEPEASALPRTSGLMKPETMTWTSGKKSVLSYSSMP